MERAMLADQCAAVYADNLSSGECFSQHFSCFRVIFRLVVCGIEYGFVHDQKVGIGCRKPLSVVIINGVGHRQGER